MIKFPDKPFSLFVDVGLSHNAPHSQKVLATNPQAFVIGVEPNPNSCNSVRSLNLGDRFYLIEAGASNQQETLTFNIIGPDQGTSSFLSMSESFAKRGYSIQDSIQVETVTLESILDQVPWNLVIDGLFDLKSDTQGFEDKVLLGLGSYIKNIRNLQIESTTWGYYDNASNLDQIKSIVDPYLNFVKEEHENAWFVKK